MKVGHYLFRRSYSLAPRPPLMIVSSKTTTDDRGTVVYMSPELLVEEKRLTKASIADLIIADV